MDLDLGKNYYDASDLFILKDEDEEDKFFTPSQAAQPRGDAALWEAQLLSSSDILYANERVPFPSTVWLTHEPTP